MRSHAGAVGQVRGQHRESAVGGGGLGHRVLAAERRPRGAPVPGGTGDYGLDRVRRAGDRRQRVALFAVSGGTVWRYGVDGSQTVLAGLQHGVTGVAVDETYVYWLALTTSDAGPSGLTLRRLPKSP